MGPRSLFASALAALACLPRPLEGRSAHAGAWLSSVRRGEERELPSLLARVRRTRGGSDPRYPSDNDAPWDGYGNGYGQGSRYDAGGFEDDYQWKGDGRGRQQPPRGPQRRQRHRSQGPSPPPPPPPHDGGVEEGRSRMSPELYAYVNSHRGKTMMRLGSVVIGILLAEMIKSILGQKDGTMTRAIAVTSFIGTTFLAGDLGTFSRRFSTAVSYSVESFLGRRAEVPLLSLLPSVVRLRPRQPFPRPGDGYSRIQLIVLSAFVGGFLCGKLRIFLCPSWLLSLGGAAAGGSLAGLETPEGDVARSVGAKLLLFLGIFLGTLSELGVGGLFLKNLSNSARFARQIDEQYGIGEKVGSAMEKGMSAAGKMMSEGDEPPPPPPGQHGRHRYDDRGGQQWGSDGGYYR